MELINKIKNTIANNLGITFVEIMIAISILAIGMTYVAVDARYSTRSLYILDEKENMLNAEQEALEIYKINQTAGQYTYNGYTVDIKVDTDNDIDGNLSGGLKKITISVSPKDSNAVDPVQLVSYVFSENTSSPTAPTGLIASPTLNGVVLDWNAPMYANSYIVKRSTTAGGPYDIIAQDITTNKYIDTEAVSNLTYYYVVAAVNTYGTSSDSTEVNSKMQINTDTLNPVADAYVNSGSKNSKYGAATTLLVSNPFWFGNKYKSYLRFNYTYVTGSIISAKLRLYGSGSANMNVDIYQLTDDTWAEGTITYNNAPAQGTLIKSTAITTTSQYWETDVTDFCKSELLSNKITSFVAYTSNTDTATFNSKEAGTNMPQLVITWTPMQPPPTPLNLKGLPDNKQAILSWDTSIGAENYVVRRATSSGGPYTIVNSAVSANSFTDTGLTNGVTYYYVVTAINGNGESGYSNEVSIVPCLTNTVAYTPEADAYVRDGTSANTNFGSSTTLESKNSTTVGEKRVTYYRANLSDLRGTVLSAKLKIFGSNIQDSTDVTLGCYDVTDESWEESAVNYSNAPALGNEIGTGVVHSTPSYREIDITSYVQSKMTTDKIINIATQVKDSSSLTSFSSKENTSNVPQIVITKTLLAPLAPTDLEAVPFDRKVSLEWDPSDETDSYTIKRGTTDGGPYSTTVATGVTGTSYDDTSVTNGTKYYYIVTATNAAGVSPNSNQACATPNVVELHTLNPVADSRVESYYPNNNYGSDTALNVVNDGVNNKKSYLRFDFTGINNNTTVSAKLRVYGNSTVNNFKINAYRVDDITWAEGSINWNNAPTIADNLGNVMVNTSSGYYEIDVTNYVVTTLQSYNMVSFGLYTDVVGANGSTFNSKESASNKPQLVVNMVAGVPKVPQNLTATGGNRVVNLSWTASDGAQTYNVKRSTTSGGPYTTIATGITATTYQNTWLTNGTRYYYIVTASNTVGESIASNEACGIPANTSNTQALVPTDDAYVRNGTYATTNYGTATSIDISNSSTANDGNTRYAYIKFDLSSIPSTPTAATLYITGKNMTNSFSTTVTIYQLTNDTWDENTVNWNTALASGTSLGTMSFRGTTATRTLSITNYAKGQWSGDKVVGLCLKVSTTRRVISCNSKEGTTDPILQVNY